MSKWLWMGLAFVLAGGIGAAWGYQVASKEGAQSIAKAQSASDTCSNVVQAKQKALDKVADREATHALELKAVRAVATAALDARDDLQRKLAAQVRQRETDLRKTAHDHPDCANLAGLPVCPAVAGRLWPAAPDAAGDHPAAGH